MSVQRMQLLNIFTLKGLSYDHKQQLIINANKCIFFNCFNGKQWLTYPEYSSMLLRKKNKT